MGSSKNNSKIDEKSNFNSSPITNSNLQQSNALKPDATQNMLDSKPHENSQKSPLVKQKTQIIDKYQIRSIKIIKTFFKKNKIKATKIFSAS